VFIDADRASSKPVLTAPRTGHHPIAAPTE
jgi:hypothetical protein